MADTNDISIAETDTGNARPPRVMIGGGASAVWRRRTFVGPSQHMSFNFSAGFFSAGLIGAHGGRVKSLKFKQ